MSSSFPNLKPYRPIPSGGLKLTFGLLILILLFMTGIVETNVSADLEKYSTNWTVLWIMSAMQFGLVGMFFFAALLNMTFKEGRGWALWPFPWLRQWWNQHQYYLSYSECKHGKRIVRLRRFGKEYKSHHFGSQVLQDSDRHEEDESCPDPDLLIQVPLSRLFRRIKIDVSGGYRRMYGGPAGHILFPYWKFRVAQIKDNGQVLIKAKDTHGNSFTKPVEELFDLFTFALLHRHRDHKSFFTWEEIFQLRDQEIKGLDGTVERCRESAQKARGELASLREEHEKVRADKKTAEEKAESWQAVAKSGRTKLRDALEHFQLERRISNGRLGARQQIRLLEHIVDYMDEMNKLCPKHLGMRRVRGQYAEMLKSTRQYLERLEARSKGRKKKTAAKAS